MIVPPARALETIDRFIPPALVGATARRTLEEMARSLPAVAHAVGFECRLREGDDRVDLGITVERDDLDTLPSARGWRPSGRRAAGPAWEGVRAFCAEWAATRELRAIVPRIFLEFDAERAAPTGWPPSVFAVLEWPRSLACEQRAAIVARILCSWRGAAPSRSIARALRLCLDGLREGGDVTVVGAMLARPGAPVRLSLVVPRNALRGFLATLACAPSVARDVAALADTRGRRTRVDLDVALARGRGLSAAGIQLIGDRRRGRGNSWETILRALVARGWCTEAKRRALLRWPGVTTARLHAKGLPVRFERYISSIKVTRRPSGEVEAKAYFAVAPHFSLLVRR